MKCSRKPLWPMVYLLIHILPVTLKAQQENVYTIGSELLSKNAYLKAAEMALSLRNAYYKKNHIVGVPSKPLPVDEDLAFFMSLIGEEYTLPPKLKDVVLTGDKRYRFKPAVDYITEQASQHQVVMINEAHQIPKHRILTMNMLENFYNIGFRYLCVEAIADDSTIVSAGYPTIASGFYTAEPGMGNLLKEAIRLGFKVLPYESDDETDYQPKHPGYAQNIREVNQANNINNILKKDPKAKILIHAGMAHIWEHGGDIIFMAEYFKNLSKIDPFTINQSVNSLREFSAALDNSRDLIAGELAYAVLDNKLNPIVSTLDKKGDYDLLVAWTTPKIIYGRFDYQLAKKGTKVVKIETAKEDTNGLLQIVSTVLADDIPVDQFVVKKGGAIYASALKQGEYHVRLVKRLGGVAWQRKLIVP